jgi:hypothetical protein
MIVPPTWNLPESIRARLGQTTFGRQRAMVGEGHVLLVLHKPPGPDDAKRDSGLFWRSASGEWQSSRGPGPGAVKRQVQSYAELETKLTEEYEKADSATVLFNLLEALTPLGRAARNMHAALQTAREAVPGDPFLIEVRDLAYEIERNLDILLEDVRNAIQYRTARESEEQARLGKEALLASHRLNSLAALFLPLTAVTSLFGMNFAHGLNEHSPLLFWMVFLVGTGVGFAVKGWVLRKPASKETPLKRVVDNP